MNDYNAIFASYVEELTAARTEVLKWWDALMAAASPSGDFDEAQGVVRPRWPAGPASHPRIVDVYRRHHLAIEELNDKIRADWASAGDEPGSGWGQTDDDDPRRVFSPQALLFERLEDEEPELASFMEYFVFISIGLDPDGRTA